MYNYYLINLGYTNKKFIILHWTPSEITINNHIEYEMITMPLCNKMEDRNYTCTYEMIPIMKYHSEELKDPETIYALHGISFGNDSTKSFFNLYHNKLDALTTANNSIRIDNNIDNLNLLYNNIACEWLNLNVDHAREWFQPLKNERVISIGGIFPFPNVIYAGACDYYILSI